MAELKTWNATEDEDDWWLYNDGVVTQALNPANSFNETTKKGQGLSCKNGGISNDIEEEEETIEGKKEEAGVPVNRATDAYMLCYIKKTALDASKVNIPSFSIWNILLFIIYMLR